MISEVSTTEDQRFHGIQLASLCLFHCSMFVASVTTEVGLKAFSFVFEFIPHICLNN